MNAPRSPAPSGGQASSAGSTPEAGVEQSGVADDPAALWPALLARLAGRSRAGWLRLLQLDRLEGDTAVLHVVPGHREVRAVATPARLEPIAAELSALRGRRTRLVLEDAAAASGRAAAPGERQAGGGRGGQAGARQNVEEDAGGGAEATSPQPRQRSGRLDRRSAMQVPVVRQALQFFPDATVIDAREENEQDANPPRRDEPASDTDAPTWDQKDAPD